MVILKKRLKLVNKQGRISASIFFCLDARQKQFEPRIFVFAALLLTIFLCPVQTWATAVVVQLKWKHQFQFAGYYAALEQGYYDDAGLKVELRESGDQDTTDDVVAGRAQFGIGSSDLVVRYSEGDPIVVLAPIFQHSPLVLLTTKKTNIDNVHSLIGKTIAMEAHSGELYAYLKSEGVSTNSLTIIPHSYKIDELIAGTIDATSGYITDEMFLLEQAGVDPLVLNPRSSGIDFYGDTIFTSLDMVRKHPDVVRKFLDASLRGWKYAFQHDEEIINLIYNKYSKRHSLEHLRFEADKTRDLVLPDLIEVGYLNEGRWRRTAEAYQELGLIKNPVPLDNFFFRQDESIYSKLFSVLSVSIMIAMVITLVIATWFYKLNRQLKKAAASRKLVEQELRQSESVFRTMADAVPAAVAQITPDSNVLYANRAFRSWFGLSEDELTPADKARLKGFRFFQKLDEVHRALLSGVVVQKSFDELLDSGDERHVDVSYVPLLDDKRKLQSSFLLVTDVTRWKELERRLHLLSCTDELTGIGNLRHLQQEGTAEVGRAQRFNRDLSIFLLDIDHFKSVNDQFGHDAGDQVLRLLANLLKESSRQSDIAARTGGEEFVLLMPETNLENAAAHAEKIRQEVESLDVAFEGGAIRISVSIGVAALKAGVDLDELRRQADQALYQAKSLGRNRVEISDDESMEAVRD